MVIGQAISSDKVQLHNAGRIHLGTVQWGLSFKNSNSQGQPSRDQVEEILKVAHRAGVYSIDTARGYGESEGLIGALLPEDQDWRVVTKLAPNLIEPELDFEEVEARVHESLEHSRRELNREYLPALLLHRFRHRTDFEGRIWEMLLHERKRGRIGALGISAASPEEAWAALEDPEVECLQVATSLLDLRLYRDGFFERARKLGRPIYVRSVYLQGVAHLEPSQLPTALSELAGSMETIQLVAREHDLPPRALYLAFARNIAGTYPVIGCETPEQLEQVLEDWSSDAISAAALADLESKLRTHPAELVDPSRWPKLLRRQ